MQIVEWSSIESRDKVCVFSIPVHSATFGQRYYEEHVLYALTNFNGQVITDFLQRHLGTTYFIDSDGLKRLFPYIFSSMEDATKAVYVKYSNFLYVQRDDCNKHLFLYCENNTWKPWRWFLAGRDKGNFYRMFI